MTWLKQSIAEETRIYNIAIWQSWKSECKCYEAKLCLLIPCVSLQSSVGIIFFDMICNTSQEWEILFEILKVVSCDRSHRWLNKDHSNSIANALELLQSFTKPSTCSWCSFDMITSQCFFLLVTARSCCGTYQVNLESIVHSNMFCCYVTG